MSMFRSSENKSSQPSRKSALTDSVTGISSGNGTGVSGPGTNPRNSTANETPVADTETHYAKIRQSANSPRPTTPMEHNPSDGTPSTRSLTRPRSLGPKRTPVGLLTKTSIRGHNIVTPHGRAAARGVELRRANMLTPGNERRRKGHQQSETPREALRALSRILAPRTKPIEPSPQPNPPFTGKALLTGQDYDMEDGRDTRPRLSMPLNDDEDDSLLLPPLRSTSEVEDDNLTQRSVELSRRAPIVEYSGRLSKSFGSIRTSDQLEDLNETGLDVVAGDIDDLSSIQHGDFGNYENESLRPDTTGALEPPYIVEDIRRVSQVSRRTSDLRTQMIPEDETETTFILPVPRHDSLSSRQSLEALDSPGEAEGSESGYGGEIEHALYSGATKLRTAEKSKRESTQLQSNMISAGRRRVKKVKERSKVSKHGIQYPSLPASVIKRLSTLFLRTSGKSNIKLSRDTLEAITLASEWFLEQVSDDLGEYSQHAGRRTIDESDISTLMKRQRQISATTTPFALALKYLPRELLQDIRMTQPSRLKGAHQVEIVREEFDVQ